jgi:hypothetical protein
MNSKKNTEKLTSFSFSSPIKKIIQDGLSMDAKTLDSLKNSGTKTFFNLDLSIRQILTTIGTDIGRFLQEDTWVANQILDIIQQIDDKKPIKPIVSLIGYAGHGKDYQIGLLEGDLKATGDVRFDNELKFVILVNSYHKQPKKLKAELLKIMENFNFDIDLLNTITYSKFMGTGLIERQQEILDEVIAENISDPLALFDKIQPQIGGNNPSLQEMLKVLSLSSNPIANDLFYAISEMGKKDLVKFGLSEREIEDFDLSDINLELNRFYYTLNDDNSITLSIQENYLWRNGELIKDNFEDNLIEYEGFDPNKIGQYRLEEKNKKEFFLISKSIQDDLKHKKEVFNPNTRYCDGPQSSLIEVTDDDLKNLPQKNVFAIFKLFEIPEGLPRDSMEVFEKALIEYHKKEVFVEMYNIKAPENISKYKNSINVLNKAVNKKESDILTPFLKTLGIEPNKVNPENLQEELELIKQLAGTVPFQQKPISEIVNKIVDKVQFEVFGNHQYETEIQNAIKSLKNNFSDDFATCETETEKINLLELLLDTYGLMRGNPKHLSEGMIGKLRARQAEIIEIKPFTSNKEIQSRIDENGKRTNNMKEGEKKTFLID